MQFLLLGFPWERKFRGNFPGDVFKEKVTLNRPNYSATVEIFQRSQNTFNVASIQLGKNHSI